MWTREPRLRVRFTLATPNVPIIKTLPIFHDEAQAARAMERLERSSGRSLGPEFEALFVDLDEPDHALVNLERWLSATGNTATYLSSLLDDPAFARCLMLVASASQPLADALIQNPELGALLADPDERARIPVRESLLREGRQLQKAVISYSHALDRLRYLKQRWTIGIALNDLLNEWEPEVTWNAISELAAAEIELAVETVWRETSKSDGPCPLMIVGFGKLAGRELNYSSDIDLVVVSPDGTEDGTFNRFAEQLSRAMSDRMGRGMLYRVDFRLRPYGRSGPLVPSMRAVEAYYSRYAEPWEIQALIRTRPICGPEDLWERWKAMHESTAFRPQVSELFLESILEGRDRTEESFDEEDFKRGSGGIRDVEFLAQIYQLMRGGSELDLRSAATLPTLRALSEHGILDPKSAGDLAESYTFLRQLEHRVQLLDDQQTHRLPKSEGSRDRVARLMGLPDRFVLESQLQIHRMRIRQTYTRELRPESGVAEDRSQLVHLLGPHAAAALSWIDPLPEPESFYRVLSSNEGSLRRVQLLLEEAPALLPWVRDDFALTEAIFSGEIEEDDAEDPFAETEVGASPALLARVLRRHLVHRCFRWLTNTSGPLSVEIANLYDSLVRRLAHRLCVSFDIIALGSYANQELGIFSDLDLLFLIREDGRQSEAETQAQDLLTLVDALRRHGAPVEVDLRLRPDGRKGLLVKTYTRFKSYELEEMEMWERFALGSSRLVEGTEESLAITEKAAYGLPLTPERLRELVAMKKRIETERMAPQHRHRNVKLGRGGLNDIEWLVRLHELRFPTAMQVGAARPFRERLAHLGEAQLLNTLEIEQLQAGWDHLVEVRHRLDLMGMRHDVIPENPDKLDRLAHAFHVSDGNAFLSYHESIRETVRNLYNESLERLRV
jgi:[glutamine synthetase] adenylyltransferase / [glutamine synthetase]-adenylyl-L-tyrosine phosphorylase